MLRIASLAMGAVLTTLGLMWFFSSAIDTVAITIAGSTFAGTVTPLTKMALRDNLSLLFCGLSLSGLFLLFLGLMASTRDTSDDERVAGSSA